MININKLKILTYPHESLKKKAEEVKQFDDELKNIVDRMFDLLSKMKGIGLAAPQIGLPLRIFITSIPNEEKRVFINPVIASLFGAPTIEKEGCLSLPGFLYSVPRPRIVTISAQDIYGKEFNLFGWGISARCWMHENDHLNGILIKDICVGSPEKIRSNH